MARRNALHFDQEGLTKNLQASTGKGVGALFPSPPTPTLIDGAEQSPPPEHTSDATATAVPKEKAAESASGRGLEGKDSSPTATAMNEDRGGSAAATATPRHRDTTSRSPRESVSRTAVRRIRKAVRQVGKEAATHRFTADEKARLMDIVYTYARRGCRSSENELVRIGVNWLLDDHEENGRGSVLHIVLCALRA